MSTWCRILGVNHKSTASGRFYSLAVPSVSLKKKKEINQNATLSSIGVLFIFLPVKDFSTLCFSIFWLYLAGRHCKNVYDSIFLCYLKISLTRTGSYWWSLQWGPWMMTEYNLAASLSRCHGTETLFILCATRELFLTWQVKMWKRPMWSVSFVI